MSVGNQPSVGGVNASLAGLAIQLRTLAEAITNQATYLNGLGSTGLVTLGFTAGDATTALNMISYLNTIAGVYKGTATQGTTFNFDNALSVLWGGQ